MKASKLLELAKQQVGVMDSPIGTCNNKYNTAYYGGRVNNPALAWCVVFIWWLFRELDASDLFCGGRKMASVPMTLKRCQELNQIVSSPAPGDIIFFDFNGNGTPDHIGVVCEVNPNGSVVTIEGNTSSYSQTNGGTVQEKVRSKAQIYALARPNYEDRTNTEEEKKNAKYSKKDFVKEVQKVLGVTADGVFGPKTLAATVTVSAYKNKTHPVVKVLQKRLNHLNYNAGEVDGIAGAKFTAALKGYQKKNGCVADGVLSARGLTWKKLLS